MSITVNNVYLAVTKVYIDGNDEKLINYSIFNTTAYCDIDVKLLNRLSRLCLLSSSGLRHELTSVHRCTSCEYWQIC